MAEATADTLLARIRSLGYHTSVHRMAGGISLSGNPLPVLERYVEMHAHTDDDPPMIHIARVDAGGRTRNTDALASWPCWWALICKKVENPRSPKPKKLSPRQRQVLEMILKGNAEKEIAHRLKLSPHKVRVHMKRLYSICGASSRGELMARFIASAIFGVINQYAQSRSLAG